jgi:hypothetical protein
MKGKLTAVDLITSQRPPNSEKSVKPKNENLGQRLILARMKSGIGSTLDVTESRKTVQFQHADHGVLIQA